ncbi:unnamed protein product [Polarella glacialis]|uniref:CSD domain-containing protein n=1 Tax=Polarella glacialis TaxID=89957 RepID=A0A813L0T8_POLGL|nr:unnamed protein product [Polarella glacialis]
MDANVLFQALLQADGETAAAVIRELLKARPGLAPSVVAFACPDLTYCPVKGMTEKRAMGLLKSFSQQSGFGIISCPELELVFGVEVFVHLQQMGPWASLLAPGNPVSFAVVLSKENKPQAYDVLPLLDASGDPQGMAMAGMEQAFGFGEWDGFGENGPLAGNGFGLSKKRKLEDPLAELGRFAGRIKSLNAEKGFGFVICEDLQQQGFAGDVFVGGQQALGFEAGQMISFTAFVNEKDQLQAKDLQMLEF